MNIYVLIQGHGTHFEELLTASSQRITAMANNYIFHRDSRLKKETLAIKGG